MIASKKSAKLNRHPIDNIFCPTDIILSGNEKLCADFFDILDSSTTTDYS